MFKDLILLAFDKAKREVKKSTGVTLSITGLSRKISDHMLEEYKFQYHPKSLRNKYNIAKKNEVVELKDSVADCLSRYLGYGNLAEFILKNTQKQKTNRQWYQINKKETSIKLYFLEEEFTNDEIVEALSFISYIYKDLGGDEIVIKGHDIFEYESILEPTC